MSKRGSVFLLAIWYLGNFPSWSLDLNFDPGIGPNSNVLALAVAPDDSVLVGGLFTEFDGTPRSGIARLHPNGALDTGFVVSADVISSVSSIAIQEDGKLLLASGILRPGGVYLTRVDQDGTPDETFAAVSNGPIHVVAIGTDGAIWIGGGFTEVNGVARNRVARLSVTGAVDPDFDPGVGPNQAVSTLLTEDGGGALLGGGFYLFGDVNVGRVIRLEDNGLRDTNFYAAVGRTIYGPIFTNYSVRCLMRDPVGRIIVGGEFILEHPALPFVSISGLVRLLPQGPVDLEFAEPLRSAFGTMGSVYSVLLEPDGRLIVAGSFSTFNGVTCSNLVRLYPDGSLDDCFPSSLGAMPDGGVHAVARQSTGRILIGGAFTAVGDVPRPFIAALPSAQPPFAPPSLELVPEYGWPRVAIGGNSKITARATSCSGWLNYQWFKNSTAVPGETRPSLVLNHPDARHAGHYYVVVSNLAGATTSGVVRLDVGTLDVDFDTSNGPLNWSVPQVHSAVWSILPLRNGRVLVGGPFLQVEGQDWPHLARLNVDGSLDRTFTARPNTLVRAMAEQPDGKVVIAGEFNGVDGQFRDRVARLEPDGRLDTNFLVRLGLNGVMRSLDLQEDGRILAGGAFYVPRAEAPWIHNLIRLDANGAIDFSFDPGTNLLATGVNVNHVKSALLRPDGMVMVAGTFNRAAGSSRDYLAKFFPNGSIDMGFGIEPLPGPNGPVYCMARQPGGLTLIGGSFTRVHGATRTNLARLLPDGSVDESFVPPPAPRAGVISALAADAGGRVLVVYSSLDSLGNPTLSQMYRYDARGRLDTNYVAPVTIRAQAPAGIHTLVPTEAGGTYIGGTFETVDGVIRRRVALLLGDPPEPPIFTTQPVDLISEPGIDRVVGASVTMSAPTSFQWYRNGEAIADGTNAALVIRYAMPVHSGPHWLVASNMFGATTSAVALVTIRDPQRPGAVDLSFAPDPGANSNVWALAETVGGQLVIGGDFTQVDRTDVSQIARLNADGRLDDAFQPTLLPLNGVRATVRTLIPKGDDTLIVGGDFRVSTGVGSSAYLCKLNSTGFIEPSFRCEFDVTFKLIPGFPRMQAIAFNEEAVFLGGHFTAADGRSELRYVLRVYENGSLDTRFSVGTQFILYPSALGAGDEGQVFVGSAQSLAKLNAAGDPDSSFSVTISKMDHCPGGNNCDGTYNAGHIYHVLVQPDGKPIIAGYFESVNNVPRRHVARLNVDGSLDSTFLPPESGLNSFVYALALQPDGRLLMGGTFTNFGSMARNRIARLNSDGSLDESFDLGEGANADVRSLLLLKDGRIAVGGRFTRFNGYPRSRVAVLHGGPVEAPTVGSTTNFGMVAGHTLTLAPLIRGYPPPTLQWLFNGVPIAHETNLVLRITNARVGDSGVYSLITTNSSGISTNFVATVNVNASPLQAGVVDAGFFSGSGTDNDVYAVDVDNEGRVLVGGVFKQFDGVDRNYIARLLPNGRLDASFNPNGSLSASSSNDLRITRLIVQPDRKVLIGGNFKLVNDTLPRSLARLNEDGTVDEGFAPQSHGLLALQPDGKILTGPWSIARLNSDGSRDESFNPGTGANGQIRAACVQSDGKIMIIGDFGAYNGISRRFFARLHLEGSLDLTFSPEEAFVTSSSSPLDPCFGSAADGSSGPLPLHLAVAIQPDGGILIGGAFQRGSWFSQGNFIRLLPSGAADLGFRPWMPPNSAVRSITVQRDGKILAGGCFTILGDHDTNVYRSHIARLNEDGSVDHSFNPGAGFPGSGGGWVGGIALQPDGRIVIGGQFSHVDGALRNNIARLGGDVQMFDPATDGQTFTTQIATVEGRTYWLERKSALADAEWLEAASAPGDGTVKALADPAIGNGPRFYRVRAE